MAVGDRETHRARALLNIGCGDVFHTTWKNIDLEPVSPDVERVDLRKGLPYPADQFDAVYHSHVLEHLTREHAPVFLSECLRVLKPDGAVRVAVPDLERICRSYLETLEHSLAVGGLARFDHEWMTLELYDQVVRTHSGGSMAEYLSQSVIPNEDFVRSRMGNWTVDMFRSSGGPRSSVRSPRGTISRLGLRKGKERIRAVWLRLVLGKQTSAILSELSFRHRGEVHLWMYDRFSLSELLRSVGFVECRVMDAFTSDIPELMVRPLDLYEGEPRKPDSLFIEARKPPG